MSSESVSTDYEHSLERELEFAQIKIHELSRALEVEITARHNYEKLLADTIKAIDGTLAENLGL